MTRLVPLLAVLAPLALPQGATAQTITFYSFCHAVDTDSSIALVGLGYSFESPVSMEESRRLDQLRDDFIEAARDLDIDYRGIASSSLNDRTPENRDADMAAKIRGFERSGYTVFRMDEPG